MSYHALRGWKPLLKCSLYGSFQEMVFVQVLLWQLWFLMWGCGRNLEGFLSCPGNPRPGFWLPAGESREQWPHGGCQEARLGPIQAEPGLWPGQLPEAGQHSPEETPLPPLRLCDKGENRLLLAMTCGVRQGPLCPELGCWVGLVALLVFVVFFATFRLIFLFSV